MNLSIAQAAQPAEVLRYDYTLIADEDERAVVISAAMTIKPMIRRTAEDLVRIGQELIAVKDYLPHGEFTNWLETEFGLHPRTARRMMAVSERLGHKMDTLSVLAPSVLYELAADSTPHDVVEKVAAMVEDGETLSTRDVKGIIDSRPMGKATYWQPEPAHANGATPTDEDAQTPEPAQPSAPKSADRTLTVEQTVDMMHKAMAERDDCPELEGYRGAGWAVYLADTYGFWPTVDTAKQAIAQIVRKQKAEAINSQRRALDQYDTEAVIDRVLTKDFKSDTERLAYLDKAGPNAYAHALRPGVFINTDIFEDARIAVRVEVAGRIAEEKAKAEAEAQRRQEEARLNAVRHDKQTMLYGLTRALAELPEAAEDTYYDLTGTTLYSTARQAIVNAIRELENTMEAKRA